MSPYPDLGSVADGRACKRDQCHNEFGTHAFRSCCTLVCSALVRSCLARSRVKVARHWSGRHSAICPSQHPRLQTTTNGNVRSDFPGHLGERSIGRPQSSRPAGFHRQYTYFGRLRRGNPASVAAQRCRLSTLAAAAPYTWASRPHTGNPGTLVHDGDTAKRGKAGYQWRTTYTAGGCPHAGGIMGRRTSTGSARACCDVGGRGDSGGPLPITAFPVRHRDTDSFGYIFKSLMRRHLDRDRLALMRVPDGPIRKELAEGRRATLPDGRIIEPADVLGPLESGSKLVVIGDAGTTDGLNAVVGDADLLVIEATFLQQDAAIARSYGHLTAAQAASLAATSNVKRLILTHISRRYSAEAILAENHRNWFRYTPSLREPERIACQSVRSGFC